MTTETTKKAGRPCCLDASPSETVVRQYLAGAGSIRALARDWRVSPATIQRILVRAGIKTVRTVVVAK